MKERSQHRRDILAKSKVMRSNKKREAAAVAKLSPAERLRIACELSDLCRDLGKAGKKVRHGTARKP